MMLKFEFQNICVNYNEMYWANCESEIFLKNLNTIVILKQLIPLGNIMFKNIPSLMLKYG